MAYELSFSGQQSKRPTFLLKTLIQKKFCASIQIKKNEVLLLNNAGDKI